MTLGGGVMATIDAYMLVRFPNLPERKSTENVLEDKI